MQRALLSIAGTLLLAGGLALWPELASARESEVSLYGPPFTVAGLQFTVPSRWLKAEPTSEARVGQWIVPVTRGQDGPTGEAVVFYFGLGVGGGVKENFDGWTSLMTHPEPHPIPAVTKNYVVNGIKISELTLFGTYNQAVPMPGFPPQPKANYGLWGAVIESPQGNIYWRITGPAALITANLPLFTKILNSVKPAAK